MADLILATSFEEVRALFDNSKADQKLMEFIEPLHDVEAEIGEIGTGITNAGKVVFILGNPGTGKSTFIQSLSWRPHIKIRGLIEINGSELTSSGNMRDLYLAVLDIAKKAKEQKDAGPTYLVVNYLENLENFTDADIKAFFRDLNGVLRQSPTLILWPVTSTEDVEQMQAYANSVSSTIFPRNKLVTPSFFRTDQK